MKFRIYALTALLCCMILTGCVEAGASTPPEPVQLPEGPDIPAYTGDAYVALSDNVPGFSEEDLTTSSFETYSPLDSLGRCGTAYACIGVDLMPTEERGSIGSTPIQA